MALSAPGAGLHPALPPQGPSKVAKPDLLESAARLTQPASARVPPLRHRLVALSAGAAWALAAAQPAAVADGGPADAGSDPYAIVDCLLPPQLVHFGHSVRLRPSTPVRTSARQCSAQGGARKAGIDAWQQLARSGHIEAQVMLGEMYENGFGGVARDLAQAAHWYRLARDAGSARAAANLAQLQSGGALGASEQARAATDYEARLQADTGRRDIQVVSVSQPTPSLPRPAARPASEMRSLFKGRFRALLIGNERYAHMASLGSPVREVEAIAEVLRRRYGFETTVLRNGTRDAILRAVDDLRQQLLPDDNLLVYYSGHGHATQTGEAYWLPVDAEGPQSTDVYRTRLWIASSTLREALATTPNRHTLVVSDSCYSGNFLRLRGVPAVKAGAAASDEYLVATATLHERHRSRSVITSGANAPVIDMADAGGLSIFARAFVDFLQTNRQVVSSNELHVAIKPRVVVAASRLRFEQEPQWGQLPFSGHEAGDFYFVPR